LTKAVFQWSGKVEVSIIHENKVKRSDANRFGHSFNSDEGKLSYNIAEEGFAAFIVLKMLFTERVSNRSSSAITEVWVEILLSYVLSLKVEIKNSLNEFAMSSSVDRVLESWFIVEGMLQRLNEFRRLKESWTEFVSDPLRKQTLSSSTD